MTETERLIEEMADAAGCQDRAARAALRAVLKRYYVVPRSFATDWPSSVRVAGEEGDDPYEPGNITCILDAAVPALLEASPISMEPADE